MKSIQLFFVVMISVIGVQQLQAQALPPGGGGGWNPAGVVASIEVFELTVNNVVQNTCVPGDLLNVRAIGAIGLVANSPPRDFILWTKWSVIDVGMIPNPTGERILDLDKEIVNLEGGQNTGVYEDARHTVLNPREEYYMGSAGIDEYVIAANGDITLTAVVVPMVDFVD